MGLSDLSAVVQCESLRYKLLGGLAIRRACYVVPRFFMESGTKGRVVVAVTRVQQAPHCSCQVDGVMDGFMIHE